MNNYKFIRRGKTLLIKIRKYVGLLNLLKFRSEFIHNLAPYSWIDDKYWAEYYFRKVMGYSLDLKHPKTFNEKIQWMKLCDRNPLYSKLADKFEVREFVAETIGSSYLNKLIGVFESPVEIDWSSLPKKFALKTTHGCAWNIICEDKEKLDIDNTIAKLKDWLSQNYYNGWREWQYKNIVPRIIIEEYLEGDPELDLVDYRVFCTNGEPQIIQVELNTHTHHTRGFFDRNWNNLRFSYNYPQINIEMPRPELLSEMLFLSSRLSANLKFCRVDFFINQDKLIFGEMTFTPVAGFAHFEPRSFDLILGKLIPIITL